MAYKKRGWSDHPLLSGMNLQVDPTGDTPGDTLSTDQEEEEKNHGKTWRCEAFSWGMPSSHHQDEDFSTFLGDDTTQWKGDFNLHSVEGWVFWGGPLRIARCLRGLDFLWQVQNLGFFLGGVAAMLVFGSGKSTRWPVDLQNVQVQQFSEQIAPNSRNQYLESTDRICTHFLVGFSPFVGRIFTICW